MNLIAGSKFVDERGVLGFNNDLNLEEVKRIYTIQNRDISFVRGWQGHKIQKRWFCCIKGAFKISFIKIDDFSNPNPSLLKEEIILNDSALDCLALDSGYVTSIQSLFDNAILLVMSNYHLDEISDEYKYPIDYFKLQ